MIKRIIIFSVLSIILLFTIIIGVRASELKNLTTAKINVDNYIDPTTNFFAQPLDKTKVVESSDDSEIIGLGYSKICTEHQLSLYLDEKNMSIAVYDTKANYIWYSAYKNYKTSGYNETVQEIIGSGVTISCYDSTTLNETTKYCATQKDCEIAYNYLVNGFKASLNFKTVGISFDVLVTLDNGKLNTEVLFDTLQEVPYKTKAMKYAKEYKLSSVDIFPYFGSDNYNINAYAFIPDGSGALIRYTDVSYDTAYIKRVYGNDYGVQTKIDNAYLKNQNDITLPIYGINHGYNQASILVEVKEGYGSCELHAYPYNYSNINLNRTFFHFVARDKYNIKMASATDGKITFINSNVYNDKYSLSYTFLNNDDASYIGMAKEYQKSLSLNNESKDMSDIKISLLCQDYKKGLFGKNYIVMTSYKQVLEILETLKAEGFNKIEVNLIGYNNNGYYDNTLTKIKLDSSLGSKKDYQKLIDYAANNNITFYYYSNPMVATNNLISKKTIKKLNLEVFEYEFKSSLELTGRLINPDYISKYFLQYQKQYDKLEMTHFSFESLGNTSFSYRYSSEDYYREEMIAKIVSEVKNITDKGYQLALSKPNAYLYNYLTSYYDANYESSKYTFITDSIPFISLILSGKVNMYSSDINYVSNYELFMLRMIEYDIHPSYILTYKPTSDLRYCNYEYLYTTEFNLWKDNIINIYNNVSTVLSKVSSASITNYEYLDNGIVQIDYSNGIKIYLNYTDTDYNIGSGKLVKSMNYLVGGDI